MADEATLCLNMIVRNEVGNLERCLSSVADHVGCWVIGDTGSTDGTQDLVRDFFGARGIPGELHSFPFETFEQARNAALDLAHASGLGFDHLLFCDADMELVVDDPGFRSRVAGPGYQLLQRSAGVEYWNTRLVRRGVGARYHGVTHEYVDVPGGVQRLSGAWYKDHASGSNRRDKFHRDIRLIEEALAKDPDSGRYWFYLAQSYRDAGLLQDAAHAYGKRAKMGGWEEEAWYAQWQHARCLRLLGDEGGYLREAMAAYHRRPTRGEPLHDLAQYYRERGMHDVGLLFSEPGLALPVPDDALFVDVSVHAVRMREEFSISANYSRDPVQKARGHQICDELALDPAVPQPARGLARWNLFFYVQPLASQVPGLEEAPGGPTGDGASAAMPDGAIVADGFDPTAPAARFGNGTLLALREVEVRDGRSYAWHRIAWADAAYRLRRLSRRFYFRDKAEERATGLSVHRDTVSMSWSGPEGGSWTCGIGIPDVGRMLAQHVLDPPPGATPGATPDDGAPERTGTGPGQAVVP